MINKILLWVYVDALLEKKLKPIISLETLSTGNRTHIKAGDIIINFMALSKYRNKIYKRHSLVNSSTIFKNIYIYISKHP